MKFNQSPFGESLEFIDKRPKGKMETGVRPFFSYRPDTELRISFSLLEKITYLIQQAGRPPRYRLFIPFIFLTPPPGLLEDDGT